MHLGLSVLVVVFFFHDMFVFKMTLISNWCVFLQVIMKTLYYSNSFKLECLENLPVWVGRIENLLMFFVIKH